ncbi:MAG: CopG family transcriptional regulator [Limisphaerales bacterium]
MKTAVQAELPEELLNQARQFVEEGWAGDLNEVLGEALRRYLDSHSAELSESFLREDVKWGLHGSD